MKHKLLIVLSRLGLLRPAFRWRELVLAMGGEKEAIGPDGLPIPSPELRVRVAGAADLKWFLEGGALGEESVRAALRRNGVELDSLAAILDFGCGCGRVLRRWRGLPLRVCGTDFSEPAVRWCQANLPFAEVGLNALDPPLAYEDASFDLVYAFSVFTHLPVESQFAWRDELRRVLRPGGLLILSVHGEAYLDQATKAERSLYDAGACVVRWPKAAGANLCSSLHPPSFVADRLARGFELVEHTPRGAIACPEQDLVVLRKAP